MTSNESPANESPTVLDKANQALIAAGRRIQLTPKAFAVLDYLHARAGRLVVKDELLEAVWPRVYVGDAVLKVAIREIRKALDDDPKKPRYIETLHRRGYRFIGELPAPPDDAASATSESSSTRPEALPAAENAAHIFIGRRNELTQLDRYLGFALAGDRQLVFVGGDPGVGKTALIETWLAQNSQLKNSLIARGQCVEQHAGAEAYLPILDALARLCKSPQSSRIKALLAEYAPSWLVQLPWLLEQADVSRLQAELLGATRERMLREMAEFLEAFTADSPLMLILEDLHWSDHATLDLLAYLARKRDAAKLMVVGTFRSSDLKQRDHPLMHMQKELSSHQRCHSLPLGFFTTEEVQLYLQTRCPGLRDLRRFANWLRQHSGGHPFFVCSAVDFLLARNLLLKQDGEWSLALPAAEIEMQVPAQLRQFLERQQQRLNHAQRRLLQCAALVGERFSAAAVARLMDCEIVAVEDDCEALVWDAQWLQNADSLEWPDGTLAECYRFHSTLHRDFFYASLPAGRRRQYHAKLANCLELAYRDQSKMIAADLAHHFESGADYARAIEFLQHACGADQARFASHEALAHLERAISLLDHLAETERNKLYPELVKRRSELLLASGQIERGIKSYEELIASLRETGADEHLATALLGLASTFFWVDRQRCLQLADEALACAQSYNDAFMQAHIRGWHAHWNSLIKGFSPEQIDAYEAAVVLARQRGDKARECQHLALNAYLCNLRSQYAAGEKSAAQGLRLARRLGDGQQYLVCQFFRAWALYYAGRWGDMSDIMTDALTIANKNGNQPWQVHFQLQQAWLLVNAFDVESAAAICEPILRRVTAGSLFGSEFFFGLILQARIHLARNDLDQAWVSLAAINQQLQQAPDSIDWILRLPLQFTLAEYWRCRGQSQAAQAAARRLISLASGPQDRTHLLYGQALLCELARSEQDEELFAQASLAAADVLQNQDAEVPLAALRVHLANARFIDYRQNGEGETHWLRARSILDFQSAAINANPQLLACYQTHPDVIDVLRHTQD